MAVKIVTESRQKEVGMMEEAHVKYVSLVKHGANRMPFRVVKEDKDKGGEKQTMYTVQSIILPKGTTLEGVAATEGMEYLSEARRTSKKSFEEFDRLDQLDSELFEASSLRMLRAGEGWMLVGKLKEKSNKGLTLSSDQVDKLAGMPVAPMDAIIGDASAAAQQALAVQFSSLYDRELWSMLDVIQGLLRQSATDNKKRKAAILTALEGFRTFLIVGLDAIGGQATKIDSSLPKDKNDKEVDDMDLKNKEFVEVVTEIASSAANKVLEAYTKQKEAKPDGDDAGGAAAADTKDADKVAAEAKAKAKADKELADKKKADANASAADKGGDLKSIKETLASLSEKVEKMGDQITTPPGSIDGEADSDAAILKAKEKADRELKDKKAAETLNAGDVKWNDEKIDTSVFNSFLTKKA